MVGARILVGAGGMLAELFLAGLAAMVWAVTGEGTLHGFAFNVMLTASVSTVVFNVNPLLRFDGYYMLSDLLDIPNLYQRSRQQIHHLVRRHAFGVESSSGVADSPSEGRWLAAYGLGSAAYRVVIVVGIILFVADEFLILGMMMAVAALMWWGLVVPAKLVSYLASSPALAGRRLRAASVTAAAALGVGVAVVPVSYAVHAAGIVESRDFTQVFTGVAGHVREVVAESGKRVAEGDVLVVQESRELDIDIAVAQAQVREAEAILDRVRNEAVADVAPAKRRLDALQARLTDLHRQRQALTVTARRAGVWVAPGLAERLGTWLGRGELLGAVIPGAPFRFVAVLPQEEAADLFDGAVRTGTVRLAGQAGYDLAAKAVAVIPYEQHTLPSATLGWQAGGTIATKTDGGNGRAAVEPFFQVVAELPDAPEVALLHGRSGRLRLDLGSRPLLRQAAAAIGQVLQKRYRL